MSTGGPGFFALARQFDDKIQRLAYLYPYELPEKFSFYELWNADAWNGLHPDLDLMAALQKEADEGRLLVYKVVRSPIGLLSDHRQDLTGVRLEKAGEGTILVGTRHISSALQFHDLPMGPATTFP